MIKFAIPLFCLLCCCSPSDYGVVEPRPALTISAASGCEAGKEFDIQFSISQQGVEGDFSLSLVLLSGQAVAKIDGSAVSTAGKWITLGRDSRKLILTPSEVGTLRLTLQARSPEGTLSEKQTLTVEVTPTSGITVQADYESQLINPGAETRIPIRLQIHKPGFEGAFTLSASLIKGSGSFFRDGHAVNDMEFQIASGEVIEYDPSALGEHILEFTAKAPGAEAKALAYVDVVKEIIVDSDVQGCFSITGTGRHNMEGETLRLALENNPGFNFEVAGWYNGQALLSSESTYPLKLSKACISSLKVKLKPRTVTIVKNGNTDIETKYVVQINGKPVVKSVWDCRTSLSADHKVSEKITFAYPGSQYNTSVIPPIVKEFSGIAQFTPGTDWAGHLYRTDGNFDIYLRTTDNPDLRFNFQAHYVESASTRYYIPANITMQ